MTRKSKRRRRKADRKGPSTRARSKFVPPQTIEEFFAMSEPDQEFWSNVGHAVTDVRAGASRRQASLKLGLDPRRLQQVAWPALRKLNNGRYVAKAYDHLLRVVVVISRDGLREVATRDSRQASKAGKHSAAVHRYLETGDASALLRLKSKSIIDAKGKRVALLTDLQELDRLGSAGVLSFESLYARSL